MASFVALAYLREVLYSAPVQVNLLGPYAQHFIVLRTYETAK
jgi:hypothetical protein